jgi:hypothetical protein
VVSACAHQKARPLPTAKTARRALKGRERGRVCTAQLKDVEELMSLFQAGLSFVSTRWLSLQVSCGMRFGAELRGVRCVRS